MASRPTSSSSARTISSTQTSAKSTKSQSEVTSAASGAVDEELFIKSFEDVPTVHVSSVKEATDKINRIKDVLADTNQDWEKRISGLKEIRSLLVAGVQDLLDFVQQIRFLEPGLQLSIKDLRSQVVREACITVAFLSQQLRQKFEVCAEALMPALVALIQNSAKVMATSATVAIRFIVKNTPASRLIPTIVTHLSSKSNIIRRSCYEFLDILLHEWPRSPIERQLTVVQEAIKKGLADADAESKIISRRAFAAFAENFREQGFVLFNSFDGAKQRQLMAEMEDPSIFNDLKTNNVRSKSQDRSSSGLGQYGSKYSSESGDHHPPNAPDLIPFEKPNSTTFSSSSSSAVRRNSSHKNQTATTTPVIGFKTRKTSESKIDRSRTASKMGISQSQPASRSGSPSSRLGYVTNTQPDVAVTTMTLKSSASTTASPSLYNRTRPKRTIAHSQGSSRDTSPERRIGQDFRAGVQTLRQAAASGRVSPSPRKSSLTMQCMAEYGKNLENAVADALRLRQSRFRSEEVGSDAASETSSVCSETSFQSCCDNMSEDISNVITQLLSGSWTDRREGLVTLQRLLRADFRLSYFELKKVTEIFTRMFHDPHSKVFGVFLETFVDFVSAHSCDLVDWYHVCMTRLLNKAGSDVLGSMQTKIARALDALRDSFPHGHQFSCVMRFIVEQSQIPNLKVKLALLNYLQGLVCQMEPACFSNNSDTRLAISRIITWTSEPKSPEVRKAAQNVLIALLHLNSSELSVVLAVLPRSFQEGASKILCGIQPLSPLELSKLQSIRSSAQASRSSSSAGGGAAYNRFGLRKRPSFNSNDGNANDSFDAEDVYNGIKKTSEDIQHLSLLGQQLDLTPHTRGSPNDYEEDAVDDEPVTIESIDEVLCLLSGNDPSQEETMKALSHLVFLMKRCTSEDVWENHFKMILLVLLDIMRNQSGKVKASSLLALKELLENQAGRFKPYAELTIMSLLEFEKDTDREVTRAADECGSSLARSISTEQAISTLTPLSLTAEFPVNLAAIKMETKVVEAATESSVRALLHEMIPGLIKGFENSESSVRKSSMLCLLAIYRWVGDTLMSHLSSLNSSKMKLLNLYISRSKDQKDSVVGRSGTNYEPSSPT